MNVQHSPPVAFPPGGNPTQRTRRPPLAFLRRPRRWRPAATAATPDPAEPAGEREPSTAEDSSALSGPVDDACDCSASALHPLNEPAADAPAGLPGTAAHNSRDADAVAVDISPASAAVAGGEVPLADTDAGAVPAAVPAAGDGADAGTDTDADADNGYAAMLREGRTASIFSLRGFRDRAHSRAVSTPGRGPASGGDTIFSKLFFAAIVIVIVSTSSSSNTSGTCDKPVRSWLLVLGGGLIAYVAAVRGLYYFLRPRRRELQEVLAYAVYLACFPLAFAWLITGSVFVFTDTSSEDGKCDKSILRVSSILICVVAILYVGVVILFVFCATALSCWLAPATTARSLSNVMRNRMPNAASSSALRSLQSIVYNPDDKEGCGLAGLTESSCSICLEPFRLGDNLTGLPCEPTIPHVFHKACIELWFSRSSACPLCKRDI